VGLDIVYGGVISSTASSLRRCEALKSEQGIIISSLSVFSGDVTNEL
jgi:hypothetical protein